MLRMGQRIRLGSDKPKTASQSGPAMAPELEVCQNARHAVYWTYLSCCCS